VLVLFLLVIAKPLLVCVCLVSSFVWQGREKRRNSQAKVPAAERKAEPKSPSSPLGRLRHHVRRYIAGMMRISVFSVGKMPSHTLRKFFYVRVFRMNVAENVVIYHGLEIRAPEKCSIGKGSIIGDNATLDARRGLIIGENVNISSNVCMWSDQHDYDDPYFRCNSSSYLSIKIGNRVWIGPNVTILPQVEIGEGAVIGAGSVVTKNVAPFTLVGGIPAKKIGDRSQDLQYCFDGNYTPFL